MNSFYLISLLFKLENKKTLNELILTKKRLVDLEDSKINLSSQVQTLKDQLQKFEQEQKFQQLQRTKEDTSTCKCNIEIQHLKAEVSRSKSSDTSGEIFRTIEKYERQKDVLTESNQALKLSLKDKELQETQHLDEIKTLKEKVQTLEKTNFKLQSDFEMLTNKFNDGNAELDKYANYLSTCQEQFNLSEQKREELKQDAQETIKLWAFKIKVF
jgi:chromosome segregation ATPase